MELSRSAISEAEEANFALQGPSPAMLLHHGLEIMQIKHVPLIPTT